jgi:tRNA (guanine37-N1)-methyltransferase
LTKRNFIFLSLFPNFFENYFQTSIAKRSYERNFFNYRIYNPRDYSEKGKVDDYPYGGGGGMLLKVDSLARTLGVAQENYGKSYVVLLSPQGKKFKQSDVKRLLNKSSNLIFVCGHYEGFDERVLNYVDEQLSIGDFITTGGEIPAMAITDSLIRGIPGIIKLESYENETFSKKKIDFDSYTRPFSFDNLDVPKVLVSGNHKEIEK